MQNEKLDIAIGLGANSKNWKNTQMYWADLVEKLEQEHKTTETFKQFMSATKSEQLKIKDVGGYVGGYLRGGRRKPANVVHRQLLTLDLDYAHSNFWEDFTFMYDNAAVLHATHKHTETSPRYRLVMPLDREVGPDEYVAVARKIAGNLGIDLFDNTTFETSRLMFWPSSPIDVDYYVRSQQGPWVEVDKVLASYADWTDSSLWPTAGKNLQEVRDLSKKQEDPEFKRGIIGAFCRSYTITEAIESFLSEVYESAGEDRFTFKGGTAAAGLVLYDNKFAYSHHGTDPVGGKLCNAFDLVRVHKFGHLDPNEPTHVVKSKSFRAMEDFARNDTKTKKTLAHETLTESKYDFIEEPAPVTDGGTEWAEALEVDARGQYLSSAMNLNIIFANDPNLKGYFKQNDFDNKRYAFKSLPWRKIKKPEPIKNVDYSGVRNYIESVYGIVGAMKIEDALTLEFERQSFHPVREYLEALEWDGLPRLDTLLIEAFNIEDNIYHRETIRKFCAGAVARIFDPGVKFDLVPILVGAQGTGKSTFFKRLGGDWFSDTFTTVTGKESFEQIQGTWIVEIAELSGLRKAEVETVKHYISKQEDTFRPAYGRTAETFKRQNVFAGTTNNKDFLMDPSGNRRFLPVDIENIKIVDNPFLMETLTGDYVGQIWAEAVVAYRENEKLYLSSQAEAIAENEQREHSETDERTGIVEAYLETELPANWEKMDLMSRRAYLSGDFETENEKGKIKRQFICVAEVWAECLGKEREDMDRYKTREINGILKSLQGWRQSKSTKNFTLYGKQKYYERLK